MIVYTNEAMIVNHALTSTFAMYVHVCIHGVVYWMYQILTVNDLYQMISLISMTITDLILVRECPFLTNLYTTIN